ncbi:MAG: shikimate kinase, partial [Planctomycetota bacterium]
VTALSITAPHKQEAQQLACTSTEVAAACQAANLLMLQASTDGWSAAHTDGQGALDALQNRGLQDASSILLIGAGGAAHAVAAEAIARGHAVTLTSRRQPNPPWPGTLWQSFEEVHPAAFDAVIQATPVGSLHTPGHLLAGQPPRAGALALDMVYHPPVTAWMLTAQSAGADVLPGTSMLVHQMVAQHRLVLPALPAPCAQSLETALQTHLQDRAPIVLVGLPASGKSTLGQALAQTLGRTFLDADVVLAQRHGTTLAAWIASDEAAFRQAEADLLRELLATPHAVIATGGGVVERPESVRLLKDAAGVVYLDCPTDVLLERQRLTPRPRLRPGTLEQELQSLLEQREPSYRDVANLVISTNEKASSGVMEILRGFGLKGIAKGFR